MRPLSGRKIKTAGKESQMIEMRFCEIPHLFLHPGSYNFTVDESCEKCVAAANHHPLYDTPEKRASALRTEDLVTRIGAKLRALTWTYLDCSPGSFTDAEIDRVMRVVRAEILEE